ncbi:hypothetical protein [Planktothricoides raciborskii]|uniref:Uncharacterized protein n=1 Tax=Planktothricoides raciborskii GIHE-MW2 TaxID=2792601 RepID=A0AAU8JC68_9CYAN
MQNYEFNTILEQICQRVLSLPKGDRLIESLRQNKDYIVLLEHQEFGAIKAICASYGEAPQNWQGEPISTRFQDYIQQVIQPQIERGEITDGRNPGDYDDRKLRWSGAGVTGHWFLENQVLFLETGPTTYPRYAQDLHRSKTDALKLMLKGLENYQDPYAYFAKAIAVTVVPISQEGYVYIGERSGNVDNPGLLNFVAGLATFREDLAKVNFYADAQQELAEEVGIHSTLNPENTKLIGIAGNPFTSETDLVFVTQTEQPDSYFKTVALSEHLRLVPLHNQDEVNQLLDHGLLPKESQKKAVAYGSRMALEYLANYHF